MTRPVQVVSAQLDHHCLVRTLKKDGCHLGQQGLPQRRLAIDLDNPLAPGDRLATRCDYLFLAEESAVAACAAAIELKKGGFGATHVATQLQAGAEILAKLLPEQSAVRFHALVVSGRFPKSERRRFMRQEVRFRGTWHPLVHRSCGSLLRSVLGV